MAEEVRPQRRVPNGQLAPGPGEAVRIQCQLPVPVVGNLDAITRTFEDSAQPTALDGGPALRQRWEWKRGPIDEVLPLRLARGSWRHLPDGRTRACRAGQKSDPGHNDNAY